MSEDLHEQALTPEGQREPVPRIYVASLADYNAGRLHGVWLDANRSVDELHECIQKMLQQSREPWAEEYAVHDFEGFGPVRLSGYTSLEVVSIIAQGLVEHGGAFRHWAELVDADADQLSRFEDCYRGRWESLAAWAEDVVDDLGVLEQLDRLPEWIQPYVDLNYDALGRDMAMDCLTAEDEEGVFVFDAS